ncbi:MAG: hypothetical protein HC831_15895 [Chloroflexia bacterium]|nr:hypothetical protein [Chloroflexia bacterium]
MKKVFSLYLLLIFTVLACNNAANNSSKSSVKTEKELIFEDFAKQLETSIKNGNYKLLNTSWDIELFKSNIFSYGKVKTNVLEGGEKYYRKIIFKSNNDMVDEVKQYGNLYLSRFHIENGTPKAFYTYRTDQGINFIEFVFSQKGNDIKIVDYFNFQMGEYYSESVYKMTKNIAKYGGNEGAYANALRLVNISITQVNDKQYEEAWETINKIEPYLLNDNYFQTKRIAIANSYSGQLYSQAINDFLELYKENEKLQLYYKAVLYKRNGNKKEFITAAKELESIVGSSKLFTNWEQSL